MKNMLTIGLIAALLSLGGCKVVTSDGGCIGFCGPTCNVIGGAGCLP